MADTEAKPRISPAQFLREVRQEAAKVTWPTRKETAITTAMVFVMVFIAAIFFFAADFALSQAFKAVLGLGA